MTALRVLASSRTSACNAAICCAESSCEGPPVGAIGRGGRGGGHGARGEEAAAGKGTRARVLGGAPAARLELRAARDQLDGPAQLGLVHVVEQQPRCAGGESLLDLGLVAHLYLEARG